MPVPCYRIRSIWALRKAPLLRHEGYIQLIRITVSMRLKLYIFTRLTSVYTCTTLQNSKMKQLAVAMQRYALWRHNPINSGEDSANNPTNGIASHFTIEISISRTEGRSINRWNCFRTMRKQRESHYERNEARSGGSGDRVMRDIDGIFTLKRDQHPVFWPQPDSSICVRFIPDLGSKI